jgi:hypothetical protein
MKRFPPAIHPVDRAKSSAINGHAVSPSDNQFDEFHLAGLGSTRIELPGRSVVGLCGTDRNYITPNPE